MKQIFSTAKIALAAASMTMIASSATAQSGQPRLEKAIAFESKTVFDVKEESANIFDAMWQSDSINLPELGLRKVSHSAPDANGWVRNEMQVGADWNGLHLNKLGYDGIRQSGVGAYRMHFRENATRVQRKLVAMGLKMQDNGESYCNMDVKVQPEGNGSVLYVSFMC